MKKKLFIFLGIFIFIIIPKNVYAKDIYPYSITLNNTNFTDLGQSYDSRLSISVPNQQSFTLNVIINSYQYPDSDIYLGFDQFPYTFIYFTSWNTADQIGITKNSSCSSSCFNGDYIQLKQLADDVSGMHSYILILKNKKWVTHYGANLGGNTPMEIADSFTFTNLRTSGNDRRFVFYAVFLSDDITILNNSNVDINAIINGANQNTLQVVNSITAFQNAINSSLNSTTSAIEDMNNALTSESGVSNSDVSNKTTEWTNKLAGTGPVSQMVLMPITLLNGYVSGINATCQPYNLGSLMGTDIVFPCITISNYVGVSLWNVIDILFSGFMIYAIGKKFVKIFNDFTNLRDNQMDELYGGGK